MNFCTFCLLFTGYFLRRQSTESTHLFHLCRFCGATDQVRISRYPVPVRTCSTLLRCYITYIEMSQILPTPEAEDLKIGHNYSLLEDPSSAQKYKCGLCEQLARDAVEISCPDHEVNDSTTEAFSTIYCQNCLEKYLLENDGNCPINQHEDATFHPSKFIRREIMQVIVKCPRTSKLRLTLQKREHSTLSLAP